MPCRLLVTNVSVSLAFIFAGKLSVALWSEGHREVASSSVCKAVSNYHLGCLPFSLGVGVTHASPGSLSMSGPLQLKSKLNRRLIARNQSSSQTTCGIVPRAIIFHVAFCYKLIKWKIIVCSASQATNSVLQRHRCRQTKPSSKCFCNFNCSAPNVVLPNMAAVTETRKCGTSTFRYRCNCRSGSFCC